MTDDAGERPFARIRLSGERFEGGRLPVDALVEIQRYQEIVLAAARREWLDEHPDEELPEGFNESFGLTITTLEAGSAQVLLERTETHEFDRFYDRGRDEFDREVNTLLTPDEPVTNAPLFEEKAFQDLAASLLVDEAFIVTAFHDAVEAPVPTSISQAQRVEILVPREKELKTELRKRRAALRHREDRAVAGRLHELNPNERSFEIETLHYGKLKGFYKAADITDDLKAVLDVSSKAPVVRIRGDLQFKSGDARRIWNATEVELLEIDGQPWSRRLVELASLTPDWDGEVPGAEMISFASLDAARDLMLRLSNADAVRPSIFPTEEGGVNLEWASPVSVSSIEISPDAEFILFNLPEGSNQGTEEETADLERAVDFGIKVAH